jgi:iron complex transport system substrate-binding protein
VLKHLPTEEPGEMTVDIERIVTETIDAAFHLHVRVGPGLLESVYKNVLTRELKRRGLTVEREKPVVFEIDGLVFEESLRVDMLINNVVLVELKSIEKLNPVHFKQVITYLRLLDLPIGLLLNFGAATMKEGIHRIVHNY